MAAETKLWEEVDVTGFKPCQCGMSREVRGGMMSGAQEAHPGREINGDIGKQIGKY